MKFNIRILIYPLIIVMLLTFVTSCSKTEISTPKDPVITWSNPEDIEFGTLLSAIQLNARADVPGNFVYTPEIGTRLNEGANQDLKVNFTPTDEGAYNTTSKTVKINVKASPTVSDIDGNVYHTVIIGSQVWMVENLKSTKYRNGDPIANVVNDADWSVLTTGAYCWYNNDADANKASYGAFYNWWAVIDSRNIAPTGWHVATKAEWTTLITFLGGEDIAGDELKETGTSHWRSPNINASNSSGFSALPGGIRGGSGTYLGMGSTGNWLTSDGRMQSLTYSASGVFYSDGNDLSKDGFSIRCVKN